MKTFAQSYLATLVVMLGLDSIWLTATAGPLYHARLGDILLPVFNPAPALVFYLLYGAGLVVFAVLPALSANESANDLAKANGANWRIALWRGALLGCMAYGTYDLTNQATLKGWSSIVTLADMVWGTTISAAAASGGMIITRALQSRKP